MDPFGVIFLRSAKSNTGKIVGNRDVNSTRLYIVNNPTYHYDSYVFGSSKSHAFMTKEWGKYIKAKNIFHFDANSEGLYGLYTKLKFIDKTGDSIKNVLIICDPFFFEITSDADDFLYKKDCKVTGSSVLSFQWVFFKAFLSDGFFVSYFDYSLFGKYRDYMHGQITEIKDSIGIVSNDFYFYGTKMKLKEDSAGYYIQRNWMFYKRKDSAFYSDATIGSKQVSMLKEIKEIFNKYHTACKMIISPLYSEEYFNLTDKAKLQDIFGNEAVYDFSGKNSITTNVGNYYDQNHYKDFIGSQILKEIYTGKN